MKKPIIHKPPSQISISAKIFNKVKEFLEKPKVEQTKKKKDDPRKYRRKAYMPKSGYVSNPLGKGRFRNHECICGSTKKVKKCCGRSMYMEEKLAKSIKVRLKATGLWGHVGKTKLKPEDYRKRGIVPLGTKRDKL